MFIQCSAWKSGKHCASGASYGLKVPIIDRDTHFRKEWKCVILELPVGDGFIEATINIDKPSFWNDTCHELISKDIRQWLWTSGKAPWQRGHPPKITVEVVGEGRFKVVDAGD